MIMTNLFCCFFLFYLKVPNTELFRYCTANELFPYVDIKTGRDTVTVYQVFIFLPLVLEVISECSVEENACWGVNN